MCTVVTDPKGCHEGDQWSIVAYGEFGCSAKISLDHLGDTGMPTKCDLNFGEIGKIYKIRITYENEDDLRFKWPIRSVGGLVYNARNFFKLFTLMIETY